MDNVVIQHPVWRIYQNAPREYQEYRLSKRLDHLDLTSASNSLNNLVKVRLRVVCVGGWLRHFPQFERNLVCVQRITSVPLITDRLCDIYNHEDLCPIGVPVAITYIAY